MTELYDYKISVKREQLSRLERKVEDAQVPKDKPDGYPVVCGALRHYTGQSENYYKPHN